MEKLKERNYAIDFLRGCACICIILIHTAWWSGTSYLPNWFSNLFLLADVPIFMFISGITYNYIESVGKNIKNILSQWNKWIFFIAIYIAIVFIFFRHEFDHTQIIKYMFYSGLNNAPLSVVGGSLWFIPMYIKVTIFCSIILYFYNRNSNMIKFKHLLFLMILLSMMNIAFIDEYIAIYSFIFLLGYFSNKNKIKSFKQFLIFEFLAIIFAQLIFSISGYGINDIQNLKFPPTIFYLLASIPGLLVVWYLKDRLRISKKNPMNYFGKNAIFFYYSQGISSSLLFLILPLVNIEKVYIKFSLMALINILMAVSIGVVITILYNMLTKLIIKIKPYILKLLMLNNNLE